MIKKLIAYDQVGVEFLENAPFVIQNKTHCSATPRQIFESFEDPEAWTRWAGVSSVEWTSPKPFGVGTTRTVVIDNGHVIEETFLVWEADRRICFRFDRCSMPFFSVFVEDFRVTELGDGKSEVTYTVHGQFRGLFKILAPVLKWMIKSQFRKNLNTFSEILGQ